MDSSFREHGSGTSKASKRSFAGGTMLANLINWLASLIRLTEEEREDAGIYLDRLGGDKYRQLEKYHTQTATGGHE